MRAYLPATMSGLRRLVEERSLAANPILVCAITPDLREWFPTADSDQLEYAAMNAAALASLHLLADDLGEPRRRVVIVIEVADQLVEPDPSAGIAAARVDGAVPFADVVAVHVDAEDAADTVSRAAVAVQVVDDVDHDAARAIRALDDHELLWYATQEVDDLVRP